MAKVFKIALRKGRKSPNWYGKILVSPGNRQRVKLFTDKTASERRLVELQREADQRHSGVITVVMDHASRPIGEHVAEYLESLRLTTSSTDHQSIAENMLRRLVDLAGWKFIRDMTVESVERAVAGLTLLERPSKKTADGQNHAATNPPQKKEVRLATDSYRNKFIMRAKAFGQWLEDRGRVTVHPLRKLKRINEKNSTRRRARRAATNDQLAALFNLPLPPDRKLSYALAAYNGLRRNEIAKLTWDRIHLSATIPFIELPKKQGNDGSLDSIPLHPFTLRLLKERTEAMPGVRIIRAVPDPATLARDWGKAGVPFTDHAGKRLDMHALRHTFQTGLDRYGVSRATKKRLMRHAASDVTDGYAHAELDDMRAAIAKLPMPKAIEHQQQKTGTFDTTLIAGFGQPGVSLVPNLVDHLLDQSSVSSGQDVAPMGSRDGISCEPCDDDHARYNPASDSYLQHAAPSGTFLQRNSLEDNNLRPDTQAD